MRYTPQAVSLLGLCIGMTLTAPARADVFDDVPEAADYTLIYTFDISNQAAFNTNGVVLYRDNQAQQWQGTFNRVAYYLTLETPEGQQFLYASMKAFSDDVRRIGVPALGTNAIYQQPVEALNVVTNVPNMVTGTNLEGGNIEFWPYNYGTHNAAGVPNASDTFFDFGDQRSDDGDYGSMQIHHAPSQTTLFAYNNWGGNGGNSDLGIGNNTLPSVDNNVHLDWTFRRNAGDYTIKTLQVLVLPGPTPAALALSVTTPQPCTVVQRQEGNRAWLDIQGRLVATNLTQIEARLVPVEDDQGEATEWITIDDAPSGSSFTGAIDAAAGWYHLELRTTNTDNAIDTTRVPSVGIGEVFIIAGQSNSANHGETPTTSEDPRVCALGGDGWRPGYDPQPWATGQGGSPWPALGDLLVARWNVPIGFASVGFGGTYVDQWRPATPESLYPRIGNAINALGFQGARALLWHQGESDANRQTSTENYVTQLQEVIAQSRSDAGWPLPWGVARVGYLPNLAPNAIAAVVSAQNRVIDEDPLVFAGPLTDELLGQELRYDQVHFTVQGLQEHAARWSDAITLPPCQGFDDTMAPDVECPDGMDAGIGDIGMSDANTSDTPREDATPNDASDDIARDSEAMPEDTLSEDVTPDLPEDDAGVGESDADTSIPMVAPPILSQSGCSCTALPAQSGPRGWRLVWTMVCLGLGFAFQRRRKQRA